jgi:Fe-S-cluster-containing hydrogenase component 2
MIGRILEKLAASHDLQVLPHLCVRTRYPRSTCRSCQEVCPANAIQIDQESVVLLEHCSGCEACVAACPTGVFRRPTNKDAARRNLLKDAAARDGLVRITCAMDRTEEGVVILPCLAGLSWEHFVAPLAWGGTKVQIKRIACDSCPLKGGMVQYERTVRQVRHFLNCFSLPAERIEEVKEFNTVLRSKHDPASEESIGRRDLFGLFRKRTVEASLRLLPEKGKDHEGRRWEQKGDDRFTFLFSLLQDLGEVPEGRFPADVVPALDVTISDRCVGCNVCETLCPTGAFRREVQGDDVRLYFTLSRCVGCRICAEACLPKAITFLDTLDLQEWARGEERKLIEIPAKVCKACSTPFSGLPGEICPRCFGSLQRGKR